MRFLVFRQEFSGSCWKLVKSVCTRAKRRDSCTNQAIKALISSIAMQEVKWGGVEPDRTHYKFSHKSAGRFIICLGFLSVRICDLSGAGPAAPAPRMNLALPPYCKSTNMIRKLFKARLNVRDSVARMPTQDHGSRYGPAADYLFSNQTEASINSVRSEMARLGVKALFLPLLTRFI